MAESTMPKAYEPKSFEEKWYKYWMENGLFGARPNPGKKRFSLVMPPPNITGALHMGHALDNTLQDVFTRYKRMLGYETLWVPGTDHASIATHAKIEEMLASEGTSRWELGREKFLERAWQWKEKYGHIITDQLKKLGSSCDWSRERFTMDEGCSRAVNEVFVRLYEKGLIYRGGYMVNFCPGCRTVISDIEVEHVETQGNLWYIRYPVLEDDALTGDLSSAPADRFTRFVEIATTRPETMLGDTAVAVNPDDPRYKDLVGKRLVLPLVGRVIPVITDHLVDPEFGTGAVKVTPAHDPNDFDMGKRHNLPFVTVISTEGKMTPEAGKYAGLDRYECRKKIVEDLTSLGYLVRIKPHTHMVGHCSRCDTVVEPLVSEQWFVKMKPLAEPALQAVRNGDVVFVPERFTKIYENWMENVRDWCISRQLWWGHRIPAWYCQNCGKVIVAREEPQTCPECGGPVKQDEDVLDTWFSSALWPFSTLGWPDDTADLRYFFPTNILVTGYDIIFFWVARMIFSSLEQTGKVPFKYVLIHGLVRDSQGRKMSKSLGNGVDPLEVVDKYGADALRISLTSGVSMGNDMRYFDEKVEGARNFCNKLWNASRYALMQFETAGLDINEQAYASPTTTTGKWIIARLERTIEKVNDALERFEPGEAIDTLMNFVWSEFCDWYIELSKEDLKNPSLARETAFTLWRVLSDILAMLHPFIPFITEEIWSYLPGHANPLIVSEFPIAGKYAVDLEAEAAMESLIEAIKGARNIRAEVSIPTGKKAPLVIYADDPRRWEDFRDYIQRLAWADNLEIRSRESCARPKQALAYAAKGAEVYLPLEGLIDLDKEIKRLERSISELRAESAKLEERLSNSDFLEKAPDQVVTAQKKRLAEAQEKVTALEKRLDMLRSARA